MKKQIALYLLLLLLAGGNILAQNLSQTVKGRILDKESQTPLIGANIYIEGSNPIIVATTDANGYFKLTGVSVGRHTITASYVGYNKVSIPEVLIGSGKEVVLNFDLKEEISNLQEVVVSAHKNKDAALNSMATLSARSFNVEETKRYAGGLDDPARLVAAFAGVNSGAIESNAIMVRGNAPSGVMWQVDGVAIANPSHFSGADMLGGGFVTMFSNQLLSNSDFFTGAFPAEYGNALAGVFDIKLRTGNNEKREHAFQAGVMGIDFSSEGPFAKGKSASYLFNYRYSTFGLVRGFLPASEGLPVYQDLCFKLNFPTKKAGTFSIWAVGGIDDFDKDAKTDSLEWVETNFRRQMKIRFLSGTAAISHTITIGNNAYVKSTFAASSHNVNGKEDYIFSDLKLYDNMRTETHENKYTLSSYINKKFSARHTNRTGIIFDLLTTNYNIWNANMPATPMTKVVNAEKTTQLLQAYTQSKFDISNSISLNLGIHYQYLALNKTQSVEPRVGIKWNFRERQSLSFAYGLHGQTQPLVVFFVNGANNDKPNNKLGFSKAHHFVIGYDLKLNENFRIKVEPYYQMLYNIPVEENSTFSIINATSLEAFDKTLVNKGSGTNYGIDVTFERFLSDGFYYLATASLFESKYKGSDKIERNTRFNNNFIVNILGGKEWQIGRSGKNNLLGINGRLYLRGGERQNAIDRAASFNKQDIVYDNSNPFSTQDAANYRLDLSFSYRINKEKYSSIFAVQINNALFSPIYSSQVFDYTTKTIRQENDGSPFPSLSWKIEF